MDSKTKKLYDGLIEFMRSRILHSVATKKCIYQVLKEQLPFAEIEIKTVNEETDDVVMWFGETSVQFKFYWRRPVIDNSFHGENFNLIKIV